jgi:hypothetical protein
MINYLNRRIFLKGLGGAVVAAPFLTSVWERYAKAQSLGTGAPKRVIIMFTHYGCVTNNWFPKKLSGELTAADLAGTSLEVLSPLASKLLIPRGIRTLNEWTASNTGAGKGRGQGNDSHTQVVGTALSLQPVTPNSNNPFSFEQATKFNAKPIGPSMDHVIAQQLSPQGTPLLLNTGGQNDNTQSAISYSAAEEIFRGQNASQAYSGLTGLFESGGAPMNADTYASLKGKSIIDLVSDDLATLERLDMSKSDKDKLAAWKELLNQTNNVVASAVCSEELAAQIGANGSVSGGGIGGSGDVLTNMVSDTLDGADLYGAIAALATACNANPIIVLKYPGNFGFRGLDIQMESHSLSHRLDNAGMQGSCLPNAIADLIKVDKYYAEKFGKLATMLDSISEGDGTVLDNTSLLWMNEMSDGNAHNHNNSPLIQAGSGGGYFKTGQIINLDPALESAGDAANGRSLSQCTEGTSQTSDGVSQGTATPSELANQPINKYFYALMNSLGMKAGADGFPEKDGPGTEITHFGYSDKTEDFTGGAGAVGDAQIHSPGQFTELLANS